MGRGLRAIAAAAAVGVVTAVISAAGGSAHAAVSAQAANACKAGGAPRQGHFSGVVHAQEVDGGCQITSDAANGTPPLIWNGGPMMGTHSTGPVVVTPIFWGPAGHPMAGSYKNIITKYLGDVAAESGRHSNVFSTLNEYYGSNGAISYQVRLGTPITDTSPLPADGCILNSKDTSGVYADGSGYDACLDDDQVIAETGNVVSARNLPVDLGHIYVLFLAKHVETCFYGGSTATPNNVCTINHFKSAGYCAYHSQAPNGMVYANLSFPIYHSPLQTVLYTCGSDAGSAGLGAIQTPNNDPDADTEVSPTSHEIMEAITDPDTVTGWYDSSGFENGDECAYVYGPTKGAPGQLYNQVINHHDYLTQEEFSNQNFFKTGLGCLQSE
jgi:hypothetical protein